jgi:hypothetical protein
MKTSLQASLAAALALLAVVSGAPAQPFSIARFVIAGGGGASAGGTFALNGTLGQHDAGPPSLIGGGFSLTGGFWSPATVPPSELPMLSIERLGEDVRVFWPLSALGFVLDESSTIGGGWSPVAFPYDTNATDISISIPAPTGTRFYRLRKP